MSFLLCVGKPNITDISDNQVVLVGSNVSLSCIATGNPLPNQIQWLKDGILIDSFIETNEEYPSAVTGIVNLYFITSQDSGKYTCGAINKFDDFTSEYLQLTVKGKEIDFVDNLDSLCVFTLDCAGICMQ